MPENAKSCQLLLHNRIHSSSSTTCGRGQRHCKCPAHFPDRLHRFRHGMALQTKLDEGQGLVSSQYSIMCGRAGQIASLAWRNKLSSCLRVVLCVSKPPLGGSELSLAVAGVISGLDGHAPCIARLLKFSSQRRTVSARQLPPFKCCTQRVYSQSRSESSFLRHSGSLPLATFVDAHSRYSP